MKLSLDKIKAEGTTQPRCTIDSRMIDRYANDLMAGAKFPPIDVFSRGNGTFILADGFHRVEAFRNVGKHEIEAKVHEGGEREAILFAVGANTQHGFNRSNEDKRRAVDMLLSDPDWSAWSDREIARQCRVSHTYVQARRDKLLNAGVTKKTDKRKAKRGGKTYSQKAEKAGGKKTKSLSGKDKTPSSGNRCQIEWTESDQQSLDALRDAWGRATRAAQLFFLEEAK